MTIEVETFSCSRKVHLAALENLDTARKDMEFIGLSDENFATFKCRRCGRFIVCGDAVSDAAKALEEP